MDGGAWQTTVHGVAESWTRLSDFTFTFNGSVGKNLHAIQETQETWVRKITWRRYYQPTSVFPTGKSHGQRSLMGYSPCGHNESDTTEKVQTVQLNLEDYSSSYMKKPT